MEIVGQSARLALSIKPRIIVLMCHRFQCEASHDSLMECYKAVAGGDMRGDAGHDVEAGGLTPGLIAKPQGQREFHSMQFGIAPPGSATSIHSTFDHSLAKIEEPTKWPWLKTIETSRCVLPITAFHARSFWGDPEGTEICFQRTEGELLHVAGLCRLWRAQATRQQVHTMSFLTRPASDYVMDHGTDRQPIFIDAAGIDDWISPQPISCDEAIHRLRQFSVEPELKYRVIRELPDGWKTHQKQKVRRRGQTMAMQDRCKHSCGF